MSNQATQGSSQLLRKMNLLDSTFLVIGAIVGSGIFMTTGFIAEYLPSPFMILIVWLLGGFFAMSRALALAELGAMYPRAGGQYIYLREAYGSWGRGSVVALQRDLQKYSRISSRAIKSYYRSHSCNLVRKPASVFSMPWSKRKLRQPLLQSEYLLWCVCHKSSILWRKAHYTRQSIPEPYTICR